MTTLVHAIPRLSHVRAHLGAYLVGVGATSALTAGAVVVFLSLATFVAFNGLPSLGGSSHDAGAAYLSSNASTPPTVAAAAIGAARGAVAKAPVPGAHLGSGSFDGSSGGGKSSGGGSSSGRGPTDPSGGGSTNPGGPGVTPPSGHAPSIPTGPAPPTDVPSVPNLPNLPSTSGPVAGAVQGVDNAAGTSLSGPTSGVTSAVDAATGALD
ncbi:MAG: hypothetical protein AABM42_03595 [Actinomycetota bacterium]